MNTHCFQLRLELIPPLLQHLHLLLNHLRNAHNPHIQQSCQRSSQAARVPSLRGHTHSPPKIFNALRDYISGLVENLALTFASTTAARPIQVEVDAVELPASDAISIGILINELVSNTCKYAYADDRDGEVRVIFTVCGGNGANIEPEANRGFRLMVEDDGCGVDEHAAPAGTGIGTQIIRAMADTLGATITQTNTAPGLRTTIERTASA